MYYKKNKMDSTNNLTRTDIVFDNNTVSFVSTKNVYLHKYLTLFSEDGEIDLKINISADFNEIPDKYHEVFLNMLTSQYLGKASFGNNPFSQCQPIAPKKWWEFWKRNYYTV
jgi:hypothetical protein